MERDAGGNAPAVSHHSTGRPRGMYRTFNNRGRDVERG